MSSKPIRITRRREKIVSDDKRVIPRYLDFGKGERIRGIFRRVRTVPIRRIPALLREVERRFAGRHRDIHEAFRRNYELASRHLRGLDELTENQKLLVGAYFTMEYSIESAALFNPSIVEHPNQSLLPDGAVRFLMSLRATGEGHLSSIVFRRGVVDARGRIEFDPPPRFAYPVYPRPDKQFDKSIFMNMLFNHRLQRDTAEGVLNGLAEQFTAGQLRRKLDQMEDDPRRPRGFRRVRETMLWLANAHYELDFPPDCLPAETVIFPATPNERNGMEDLRLVRFVHDDGRIVYYGTYTAFDGVSIYPMLLETPDFHHFHIGALAGRYARNKGMALFPRKVGGQYLMLGRHDGENVFLLRSDDLYVWNHSRKLMAPEQDWELVQLGNCGSPIETPEGWLVVFHGVGPVRRYCMSVALLDLNDPSKVLGRLSEPLLAPSDEEREGYVPNVVYSCGSMAHRGRLIMPYAMSDSRTAFATVSIRSLLERLLG